MYFVMYRGEDNVHTKILQSPKELTEFLNDHKHYSYFLSKCPDIESFPSYSMFIFSNKVIIPKPNVKQVIEGYDFS